MPDPTPLERAVTALEEVTHIDNHGRVTHSAGGHPYDARTAIASTVLDAAGYDALVAQVERVRAVAEGHRFRGWGVPDDLPDEFQTVADEVACDVVRALDEREGRES